MLRVQEIDLSKYPKITCLQCRQKGRQGIMKAEIFETAVGPKVMYSCTNDCRMLVHVEEVSREMLIEEPLIFA